MPSFAFPSTASAVVRAGARPVFAEVDPRHLGLDPRAVQRVLSPCTRAILYVDYGGFPGALEEIQRFAAHHRIPLIEDAAHALGSRTGGRPLGSFGSVGCVSFHETKLVTCGEGGVFLTNDDALAEAASVYREYGTNRSAFFRGEVDHYEWVGEGSSALLAEPLAALLLAQLNRLPEILERQRARAQRYLDAFAPLAETGAFQMPMEDAGTVANWHIFYLLMKDSGASRALIAALRQHGVDARRHFVPLHRSAYAQRAGLVTGPLPVTESVAERLVRLPIYPALTASEQTQVIEAVCREGSHHR